MIEEKGEGGRGEEVSELIKIRTLRSFFVYWRDLIKNKDFSVCTVKIH